MQFPDFGPIVENKIYALRGLDEGSKLFKFIGGSNETLSGPAGNMNLHYLALTMALVGGLSFFLSPKMRSAKNIICWLILVFLLLIGPYKNDVFFISSSSMKTDLTSIKCPVTEDGETINPDCENEPASSHFFAPQVAVIDITSRIHRALYDSFFGEGGILGKNILDTAGAMPAFKGMNQLSLKGRPDLQQEVSMYTGLCGSENGMYQLTLAPYSPQSTAENALAGYPVALSENESISLRLQNFTMQDVIDAINNHSNTMKGANANTYHPVGVYYDKDDYTIEKVYSKIYGFADGEPDSVDETSEPAETLVFNAYKLYSSKNGPTSVNDKTALENAGYIDSNTQTTLVPYSDFNKYMHAPSNDTANTSVWYNVRMQGEIINTGSSQPYQIKRSGIASDTWFVTEPYDQEDETPEKIEGQITLIKKANLQKLPVALGLIRSKRRHINDAYEVYKDPETKKSIPLEIAIQNSPGLTYNSPAMSIVHNCEQFHADLHDRLAKHLVEISKFPASMITGISGDFDKTNAYPQAKPTDLKTSEAETTTILREAYDSYMDQTTKDSRIQFAKNKGSVSSISNDDYREYVRKELNRLMIFSAFSANDYYIYNFNASDRTNNFAISQQNLGDNAIQNFRGPGRILSFLTDFISDIAVNVGSWFKGGEVQAYLRYLRIMIAMALLIILMMTPLVMMMGLVIPSYAPGILILTIGSVFILKMIPAMFTVIDAGMTMAANMIRNNNVFANDVDQALMIYVMATAYTSVVGATMWILFKSGDASQLSNLQQLDSAANKVADSVHDIAKGLAVSAAALAVGAPGAIAKGAIAGVKGRKEGESAFSAGLQGALIGGGGQALETIKGAGSNIPGVSEFLKQANPINAAREAEAHVASIQDNKGKGESLFGANLRMSSQAGQQSAYQKYNGSAGVAGLSSAYQFRQKTAPGAEERAYQRDRKAQSEEFKGSLNAKFTVDTERVDTKTGIKSPVDGGKTIMRDVLYKEAQRRYTEMGVKVNEDTIKTEAEFLMSQYISKTYSDIAQKSMLVTAAQKGEEGQTYFSQESQSFDKLAKGATADIKYNRVKSDIISKDKFEELMQNLQNNLKDFERELTPEQRANDARNNVIKNQKKDD